MWALVYAIAYVTIVLWLETRSERRERERKRKKR